MCSIREKLKARGERESDLQVIDGIVSIIHFQHQYRLALFFYSCTTLPTSSTWPSPNPCLRTRTSISVRAQVKKIKVKCGREDRVTRRQGRQLLYLYFVIGALVPC